MKTEQNTHPKGKTKPHAYKAPQNEHPHVTVIPKATDKKSRHIL